MKGKIKDIRIECGEGEDAVVYVDGQKVDYVSATLWLAKGDAPEIDICVTGTVSVEEMRAVVNVDEV